MLSLLSSEEQERNTFKKPSKPCHIGIQWIALTEYSRVSTYVHHFVLAKWASISIKVRTGLPPNVTSVWQKDDIQKTKFQIQKFSQNPKIY